MNPRRWLHEHSLRLLAIRDTPEAIAGGVAIGIFFGFSALFGLKTLLTILFAWLTRSNILAAVLASASHDILLPLMPVIYRFEYDIGFWLLSRPHHLPPPMLTAGWENLHWRSWLSILNVGKDLLFGSIVCAAPPAVLAFFITRKIVARHHARQPRSPSA